jgi:hypothetical protein
MTWHVSVEDEDGFHTTLHRFDTRREAEAYKASVECLIGPNLIMYVHDTSKEIK